MPWLLVTEEGHSPRVLEITTSPFRIGRRAGNDLVLSDYGASREHSRILREGPEWRLVDLGAACAEYQDRALVNLPCRRIQADEIWAFCYAKQKNVPADKAGAFGYGDIWTWTALCADTKLVASWIVGRRDAGCAHALIQDLAPRLRHRVERHPRDLHISPRRRRVIPQEQVIRKEIRRPEARIVPQRTTHDEIAVRKQPVSRRSQIQIVVRHPRGGVEQAFFPMRE